MVASTLEVVFDPFNCSAKALMPSFLRLNYWEDEEPIIIAEPDP